MIHALPCPPIAPRIHPSTDDTTGPADTDAADGKGDAPLLRGARLRALR